MDDVTRSSMLSLIADRIDQVSADPAKAERRKIDSVRKSHAPAEDKRCLLRSVWREAGAEGVLSIGQNMRRMRFDPLWRAALRSDSPAAFLDKWRRFEAYGHSRHRIGISQECERRATFKRYVTNGPPPAIYENLLMCGVLIGILETLGCVDLTCDMPLVDGGAQRIRSGGAFHPPDEPERLSTTSWIIEWGSFSIRAENQVEPSEAGVSPPMPDGCDASLKTTIERSAALMSKDPSRLWKITELAGEVGLSTRSLQRKLQEAGLSFSELVRLVRIQEACRLLRDNDMPITMIGFCAGFSDSAHFSRDFRASIGMPPSEYRASFL